MLGKAMCAAAMVATAGWAQTPPKLEQAADLKGLAARWTPLLEEFLVPGMAVAVVKDGKLLAAEGFGTRDAERGKPVTPETMFYIASITKTYTAFEVCRLAEQGKLSLDDPVVRHLPRFKLSDERATGVITVRDLLTHGAGLQMGEIVLLDAYSGEITEDRYYTLLAKATPDSAITYSNIHYTLLGRIVEAKTGVSWRDALERDVFVPAGMSRTTGYASRMYGDANHADPMEWLPGRGFARASNVKVDSTMHAAGGLGTTALDMGRWLCVNLNDGATESGRLLGAAAVKDMQREQAKYSKPNGSLRIRTGHGLAWETGTFMGRPLLTHGGGYEGASAYIAMLPEQKAGFAILMNSGGSAQGLSDVIAIDLLNRLTGENVSPNLLDGYLERVRTQRAEAEKGEPRPGDLAAAALTGPADKFVGTYVSPDWGTWKIAKAGDKVRMTLGACTLRIKDAGPDAFTIMGPAAQNSPGSFEKDGEGRVVRVRVKAGEKQDLVFERAP